MLAKRALLANGSKCWEAKIPIKYGKKTAGIFLWEDFGCFLMG